VVFFFYKKSLISNFTYRTLENLSEGLYKEKGSKFIAYACQCNSENEAKELLNLWKKEHHQARHLCYAYRFGVNHFTTRANDDGEPSNSAGAPILGQIQSYELTNTLIGVVRYFGGTKLGVGGLITAYKSAAKEAIENGNIITKELQTQIELNFPYEKLPQIMTVVKNQSLQVINQDFQLHCKLQINFPKKNENEILNIFKNIPLIEISID
jgi:uncharacterized YigZ family protein